VRLSEDVRNDRLAAIYGRVGGSPTLEIWAGDAGQQIGGAGQALLVLIKLPEAWLERPAGGVISKAGEWRAPKAMASGRAGFFLIRSQDGVARMDGSVSADGGFGDIEIDSVDIRQGQSVEVTAFVVVDGNG
jgi:hypothetical protein